MNIPDVIFQDEHYLLSCMDNIELDPVHAAMAQHPYEYKWQSYLTNAYRKGQLLISQHECQGDRVVKLRCPQVSLSRFR